MGFWEWMGFENPRDSPKTEQPKEGLPQITDNVRDSGQTFVFGRSNAGEQVDEKAAMQIPTVYACVRLLAESIAALPLHLYRVTDNNGNKEKARDHPLYKILYRQPNPEMTAFVFWETLMTHLLLWGNAYAQIVRDGKNTILGLYPLLPENVEVDRDESGELYYIYHAYTDEVPGEQNKDIYFRRDEIFHVPGLGFNGLIGFSPIAMMKNSLGTSIAVDKYLWNRAFCVSQPCQTVLRLICVLLRYLSLPEVRGKGQKNDEHDDWSSSNQWWRRGSPLKYIDRRKNL